MTGKRWTKRELESLRDCYSVMSVRELRSLLKRTGDAIVSKAYSLGLSAKRKGSGTTWTEKDDAKLLRLLQVKASIHTISRELDRTPFAVYARKRYLLPKRGTTNASQDIHGRDPEVGR